MGDKYNSKSLAKETGQDLGNQSVGLTRPYEKPLFAKQTTMNFPEEILEHINKGRFPGAADSCSRCHHCR